MPKRENDGSVAKTWFDPKGRDAAVRPRRQRPLTQNVGSLLEAAISQAVDEGRGGRQWRRIAERGAAPPRPETSMAAGPAASPR